MAETEASTSVIGQAARQAIFRGLSPSSRESGPAAQDRPISPEAWLNLARCRVRLEPSAVDRICRGAELGRSSVGEFLSHVDQVLGRRMPLQAVARRQGLSRAVFTKRFRSSVGLSFHQYLIKRRVEVARRLLLDTSLDLSFISEETGFCSTSHFVDVFRTLAGVTPMRFREQCARERGREAESCCEEALAGSYC